MPQLHLVLGVLLLCGQCLVQSVDADRIRSSCRLLQSKDGYVNRIDETFVSKNGYFSVSGCQRDLYKSWEPELHIYHTCKQNQRRMLKLPINSNDAEYKIPQAINLRSYFTTEEQKQFDNRPACIP
ncbi:Zinc transporter ZIP12 [Trichinella pseudospiralis]